MDSTKFDLNGSSNSSTCNSSDDNSKICHPLNIPGLYELLRDINNYLEKRISTVDNICNDYRYYKRVQFGSKQLKAKYRNINRYINHHKRRIAALRRHKKRMRLLKRQLTNHKDELREMIGEFVKREKTIRHHKNVKCDTIDCVHQIKTVLLYDNCEHMFCRTCCLEHIESDIATCTICHKTSKGFYKISSYSDDKIWHSFSRIDFIFNLYDSQSESTIMYSSTSD